MQFACASARCARRLRDPPHGWLANRPAECRAGGMCASTVRVMSMTQLVVGTAIGFLAAQAGLYGMKHLLGWLQREETRARLGTLIPSPGHTILSAFIRYAAPIGASAALITLGVWAVGDYLAAKSAAI